MTVEELSERIVNGDFIEHSDESELTEFQHYGVLGMKWGVRRDRQRKGESDQQYKERLDRESRERVAAADRKARAKEQKRTLRSQERIQKAQIRSNERKDKAQRKSQEKSQAIQRKAQEKQQEAQRKAQEKQQKKDNKKTKSDVNKNKKESATKSMSDAELRDAINRMKAEREYAQLSKKPDSPAIKTAKSAGRLLTKVGSTILVTQLTKIGTKKLAEFIESDGNSSKAKETVKKAKSGAEKTVNTASDVVVAVNQVSRTISKNASKLDLDAFNAAWKTNVYYDDRRKG